MAGTCAAHRPLEASPRLALRTLRVRKSNCRRCAKVVVAKDVAIGRKNWLSVGNEMTGQEAANIMTVVMTCRALDIDPQIYLTRTLQDLARSDGTDAQVEQWTPMRWKDRGLDVTVIEEHREHIGKVLAAAVANAARTSPPPK